MSEGRPLWFFLAGWVLLGAGSARADVPPIIPLQGYLTDAQGVPTDGAVRIDVFVYDAESAGNALFSEQHDLVVDNGAFSLFLGSETPLDLALVRDHEELWLELVVGGDQIISPRTRLGSLPFAAVAQYCGHADSAATAAQATDADTVDGRHAASFADASHTHPWSDIASGVPDYQIRASGTCAAGSAIRAIAADGTVTCEPDADTQLTESQVEAFVTNGPLTLSTGCERVTCSGGDWITCDCPAGKYIQAGGCNANSSPHYFQASWPISLTRWQCGGHGGTKIISMICCRQQ